MRSQVGLSEGEDKGHTATPPGLNAPPGLGASIGAGEPRGALGEARTGHGGLPSGEFPAGFIDFHPAQRQDGGTTGAGGPAAAFESMLHSA